MSDLLAWGVALMSVLALLLWFLAVHFVYSGLLTEIHISTGPAPVKNITVAYKYSEGPYREASLLLVECSVIAPELPTVGIFYDDPKKVSDFITD